MQFIREFMNSKPRPIRFSLAATARRVACLPVLLVLLSACGGGTPPDGTSQNSGNAPPRRGFEVKFLVGSALGHFCEQAAAQFNQQRPKLENGQAFYLSCQESGSGDVVNTVTTLAENLKSGAVQAESPDFPTLLSVDGEIYHNQLIYEMNRIFPGQDYIPAIADAPLLANSPMVLKRGI